MLKVKSLAIKNLHFRKKIVMIEFKKPSEFPRGTLYNQLVDAYSFNDDCKKTWDISWQEYENYFYDNLNIADKYSFITVLDGMSIGHISWDPRANQIMLK